MAMKSLTIDSTTSKTPLPEWAVLQRKLLARLNEVAPEFVKKYTNVDGTLKWKSEFGSMDGSDDPYEAFQNLALLYAIGGNEEIYELARKTWEGITLQWTEYGQIHREFDGYYDWMHHGEGYLYFYFMGLTKPESLMDRQRARRFAQMYMGEDPLAENYDKKNKIIRSPLNGSRGPRFVVTEEDWLTHQTVLDDYLAPYEDIEGVDFASMKCQWSDPIIYRRLIEMMNKRMNRGDVPLNLNATTLVTHAYMYSHDKSEKDWVLDYLKVWSDRASANDGYMPDNVGLNGIVGEYNDGKWWGGYYGWRWPHGFTTIMEPLTNAAMNAVLLTGDYSYLDIPRKQFDKNWELRKSEGDRVLVPHRRFDSGWADFRDASPRHLIYLWTTSLDQQDLDRIAAIPRTEDWSEIIIPGKPGHNSLGYKHFIANTLSWFEYIQGRLPQFPKRILEANLELIEIHMNRMNSNSGDPKNWDTYDDATADVKVELDLTRVGYQVHAWQWFCPVYLEGLMQLTTGSPMHISHGGFQFANIRPFDGDKCRTGLPEDVSVLVDSISKESYSVHIANIGSQVRTLVLQAGGFGEHQFLAVEIDGKRSEINDKYLSITLEAHAQAKLVFTVRRFANDPTYETPWSKRSDWHPLITGRPLENFTNQ